MNLKSKVNQLLKLIFDNPKELLYGMLVAFWIYVLAFSAINVEKITPNTRMQIIFYIAFFLIFNKGVNYFYNISKIATWYINKIATIYNLLMVLIHTCLLYVCCWGVILVLTNVFIEQSGSLFEYYVFIICNTIILLFLSTKYAKKIINAKWFLFFSMLKNEKVKTRSTIKTFIYLANAVAIIVIYPQYLANCLSESEKIMTDTLLYSFIAFSAVERVKSNLPVMWNEIKNQQ